MMDQYSEIKSDHPDTILFFRMGDFYEMFHEDAVLASEILGLTLTSRDKSSDHPIPMAGFPWHAKEDHLRTMLRAGHKVTLCDQEPTLRPGAKILERVVTRIYTPGSLVDESMIGLEETSTLAALSIGKEGLGVAFLDPSTGSCRARTTTGPDRWDRITDDLSRWSPDELVIHPKDAEHPEFGSLVVRLEGLSISHHETSDRRGRDLLTAALDVRDLGHLDLDEHPMAMRAAGVGLSYLHAVLRMDGSPIRSLDLESDGEALELDRTTARHLELERTLRGDRKGSLLSAIDRTRTTMGRRRLREWLLRPMCNVDAIETRQDAIQALSKRGRRLTALRSMLTGMRDLERLSTRADHGRVTPRDAMAIANALHRLPGLKELATEVEDPFVSVTATSLDGMEALREHIETELVEEPPLTITEGGIFSPGIDETLDDLRQQAERGHDWVHDHEAQLRQDLNIPSLKIRTNRQIGIYIEVTNAHLAKVPDSFIRRQQMKNGSRYTTEDLRRWEDEIMNAGTRAQELERARFLELREALRQHAKQLGRIASDVATIDALLGLAELARTPGWVRPKVDESHDLILNGARHPVLESDPNFVPNDLTCTSKRRFTLITGPNMGGKSTYLRTAALVALLAQVGSHVPCDRARVGIIDRIFTRVGASDDLRRGRSTFMVEMIEVAHILRSATDRSLVLLDEVGRGTSTFDGLALAWSICEDLVGRVGARALFATHYHQLSGLEQDLEGFVNVHVRAMSDGRSLTFLHAIEDGPTNDSFGIQVAALAGLPNHVIERSMDLQAFLEDEAAGARAGEEGAPDRRHPSQRSIFGFDAPAPSKVEVALRALDLDALSPRRALEALYELKSSLEDPT